MNRNSPLYQKGDSLCVPLQMTVKQPKQGGDAGPLGGPMITGSICVR